MTLQMVVLGVVLLGLSSALVCPDGGMCEDRETCCRNNQGGYGCCPLPHAECCSDHLHCCFQGTVCDLVHQKCVNKSISLPWIKRVPTNQAPLVPQHQGRLTAVMCPDKESECPERTTCCQLPDGSWGCCPLPKAVCCEDKRHCCPEGTLCDLLHSKCVLSSLQSFPLLKKLPARRTENPSASAAASVICPGGKSSCPEDFTCCQLTSGEYGCCPYPEATCCSDHLHCCPSHTTCDLEQGVCRSAEVQIPLMKKVLAVSVDIVCPDKKSVCPDQTTCCQMINRTYGCCPLPDAVCCSDHVHCCPAGTRCDLKHQTCKSIWESPSVSKLLVAVKKQNKVHAVPCNDSVACADGDTCCRSAGGEWACCPLPQAVCCKDHQHCCPHGSICNLKASTCDHPSGSTIISLVPNTPVFPLLTENRKCDKSTWCPGDATCCKATSGRWACCPLPQAVCCDDHVHCCPHGSICNLEAETCDDPSGFPLPLRWKDKVPALTTEKRDEKCDKRTRCPAGTTCCKTGSGLWGCCPLPQAVCCNDHQHCCPRGYRCNMTEQTCDKPGSLSIPWVLKVPARHHEPIRVVSSRARFGKIKCDAQTTCPKDTTCCFMENQHWGCCPLPQAVCCKDGNHCCPAGHTCDPHRSSCSRGSQVIPWFTKLSARTEPSPVSDIKCDNKSSCASGTTCCKLPSGEWGCCPLVKAVCCDDHEHCCPQGYTCNMKTGTCEKQSDSLLLSSSPQSEVVRSELQGVKDEDDNEEEDVPCDSSGVFRCPKRGTCCRISDTEWSCCSTSQAVCCSDSKHCCPAGFSCDPESGSCTRPTWNSLENRDFVGL